MGTFLKEKNLLQEGTSNFFFLYGMENHFYHIRWPPLNVTIFIPAFFFRKKGHINFVSKLVRRPSVFLSVHPSFTFFVNVFPLKQLEVATSNFVVK